MSLTSISELTDPDARRAAKVWFDRFKTAFTGDQAALAAAVASLEAHLIEALDGDFAADARTVNAALSRLGPPEALAAEWSGQAEAATPRAPAGPGRRLILFALRIVRAVGVALGLVFLIAALARLVDPGSVGLFQLEDGNWLMGTRNARSVAADVLGVWTAPLFALAGAGFMAASLGGLGAVRAWLKRSVKG